MSGRGGLALRLAVAVGLGGMVLAEGVLSLSPYSAWALAAALVAWCARPFHGGLWSGVADRAFRRGSVTEPSGEGMPPPRVWGRPASESLGAAEQRPGVDMLVSLSALAAFALSTVAIFGPGLTPPGAGGHRLVCVAGIVTLALAGRWLEAGLAAGRGAAVARLRRRIPATARVSRSGQERMVPVGEVAEGERVLVRPGEPVPLDGEVVEGRSVVEEWLPAGPGSPAEKAPGSRVYGGSLNKTAPIAVASSKASAMALSRLLAEVGEGLDRRPRRERLADQYARAWVPATLLLAVATALALSWQGPEPRVRNAVAAFAAILAAATPWTLGLATPLALRAAARRAAELGVRVRDLDVLENPPRPDFLVFDKTGLLTVKRPELAAVLCFAHWSRAEVLRWALAAESRSLHPVAQALRLQAGEDESAGSRPKLDSFESFPGCGVCAALAGRRVLVGSLPWLALHGVEPPPQEDLALQSRGESLAGVAVDGVLAGVLAFTSEPAAGAAEALRRLEAMGMEPVLASGDRNAAAYRAAEGAGVGKVFAEVAGPDRLRIVSELQRSGRRVALVGEALRDAAALSRADLGVAVGALEPAADPADLELRRGELAALADALALARGTRRAIRGSLLWCFACQAAVMPLAAGVLYPSLGLAWSPGSAAAAAAAGLAGVLYHCRSIRRFSP